MPSGSLPLHSARTPPTRRRTLRQLSLDVHLLRHLPSLRLPPRCRQLALVGEEREVAMRILMAGLPDLIPHLPGLRHLILEPAAMWTLDWLRREGCQPALQLVAGHWRPTRLPGQPVPPRQGQDVLKQLEQAGIRVVELERQQRLPELLSELEAEQG